MSDRNTISKTHLARELVQMSLLDGLEVLRKMGKHEHEGELIEENSPRDPLHEAYQELLDSINYICLCEDHAPIPDIHPALRRRLMNIRLDLEHNAVELRDLCRALWK